MILVMQASGISIGGVAGVQFLQETLKPYQVPNAATACCPELGFPILQAFSLVDAKELAPMQELIDQMVNVR